MGKKAVSEEDFIAQAKAFAAKSEGIAPEKVVEKLIEAAKDKQGAIEYITNFFKKNKVGDALEATADGGIKVTEKGVKWLRTVGTIGLGGLLTTGILLAIFNPEFYVDLAQKYREAGAKYNDQYKILLARFGQQFKELPDELKQFLSKEFSVEELTTSRTNVYLKSFDFTPKSETAAGLLVVTMSDGSKKEYETLDNKTFTQISGTPSSGSSSSAVGGTKTKAEIIEKIKKQGFIEPIVLTPDEDNQPNYTFTAGDDGNGIVNVKDGNITVSIPN